MASKFPSMLTLAQLKYLLISVIKPTIIGVICGSWQEEKWRISKILENAIYLFIFFQEELVSEIWVIIRRQGSIKPMAPKSFTILLCIFILELPVPNNMLSLQNFNQML